MRRRRTSFKRCPRRCDALLRVNAVLRALFDVLRPLCRRTLSERLKRKVRRSSNARGSSLFTDLFRFPGVQIVLRHVFFSGQTRDLQTVRNARLLLATRSAIGDEITGVAPNEEESERVDDAANFLDLLNVFTFEIENLFAPLVK